MFHLRRRFESPHRGQSLVEFALLLPVFLLLFGTTLDLGRIAAAQLVVTSAAREGALQAAKTPTDFDSTSPCPADGESNLVVCRTVLEARNTGVDIAPADIALTCSPTCDDGIGNRVTVRVTGRFQLLTPFLTPFFGGNRQLLFSMASTHQIETFPAAPAAVILTSAPPTTTPEPSEEPSPTATPTGEPCTIPSAGFTYRIDPANRRAPADVTFTDTSTSRVCGISSWFWQFWQINADGTETSLGTSQDPNPGIRHYGVAGAYAAELLVSNGVQSGTSGKVNFEIRR